MHLPVGVQYSTTLHGVDIKKTCRQRRFSGIIEQSRPISRKAGLCKARQSRCGREQRIDIHVNEVFPDSLAAEFPDGYKGKPDFAAVGSRVRYLPAGDDHLGFEPGIQYFMPQPADARKEAGYRPAYGLFACYGPGATEPELPIVFEKT